MIRTTYPDRICYRPDVIFTSAVCFSLREFGQRSAPHVLLGNPDGVDPDSLAHSCHPGEGSLHLAHGEEFYPAGIPPHPDISHPDVSREPTFHIWISHSRIGEETFQLLRSDISGSSDSAQPESFSLSIQCCDVILKFPYNSY